MESSDSKRPYIFILVAVAMVLASRCFLIFSENQVVAQLASLSAFFGTEGLIVLSGFFIAFDIADIFKRRYLKSKLWLIMGYFIVLAANFIALSCGNNAWKYLLLIQRISVPSSVCFPESWIVPVMIFGVGAFAALHSGMFRFFKRIPADNIKVMSALTLIFAVVILKAEYFKYSLTLDQWDWRIHLSTLCRLDSLCIGILAGFFYQRNLFSFRTIKWSAGVAGAFGIMFFSFGVGYFRISTDFSFFWNVIYLPLVSLSIALLIVSFGRAGFSNHPLVRSISGVAACCYLIYYLTEKMVLTEFPGKPPVIIASLYIASTIIAASIIFLISKKITGSLNIG